MNPKKLQEKHLLEILVGIESKRINIELDKEASKEAIEQESGIYFFKASNNWTIGIFVDCGLFDYIDSFQHGGTKIDYATLNRYYKGVVDNSKKYRNKDLSEKVWGIKPVKFAGI